MKRTWRAHAEEYMKSPESTTWHFRLQYDILKAVSSNASSDNGWFLWNENWALSERGSYCLPMSPLNSPPFFSVFTSTLLGTIRYRARSGENKW
jgi:hypothetical protein